MTRREGGEKERDAAADIGDAPPRGGLERWQRGGVTVGDPPEVPAPEEVAVPGNNGALRGGEGAGEGGGDGQGAVRGEGRVGARGQGSSGDEARTEQAVRERLPTPPPGVEYFVIDEA